MAALATTFPSKLPQPPPSLSLASLHSSIAGLRLCKPNSSNFTSQVSAISVQYGGGSSSRSGLGDRKRSRQDQALDLSTIRSDNVRLIDQQRQMVGVVSKRQALQMAEDAELDLVILSPDADPPVLRIMDYNKYKFEQQKKKREQQKKSAASRMDLKELKMGNYKGKKGNGFTVVLRRATLNHRHEQQIMLANLNRLTLPITMLRQHSRGKNRTTRGKKGEEEQQDTEEKARIRDGESSSGGEENGHSSSREENTSSYNIDVHDYSVRLKAARKFLKDGDKVKVIVNLKGRENEFRNNAIELIRHFQDDVGELAIEESKNFSVRNIFIVLVPNKAVVQKAQELPKKKEKSSETEVSATV